MEMNKHTVSLIIPVYNRQKLVEECVHSVLAQSYQQFEILLIDDGSTDNTVQICRTLAEADPRIKLLTGKHAGVSAARNIGLDSAVGEYVFFLDSDDIIHPQLLEALVTGIETYQAAFAGTRCRNCPEENWAAVRKEFLQNTSAAETTYYDHQEALHRFFTTPSPLGMIGGIMMRRDWIGSTRFRTDLFIGEDFYFIYENLIKGANAVFLKPIWYLCRHHAQNTSWQYDFNGFWTRFCRRKLVWESEEALGRKKYADLQKRDAFGCFMRCFRENSAYSADSKKMRLVLKEHKGEILPALDGKARLVYRTSLFCPAAALLVIRTAKGIQKVVRRINRRI